MTPKDSREDVRLNFRDPYWPFPLLALGPAMTEAPLTCFELKLKKTWSLKRIDAEI